jgi:hypothetical protein
MFMCWCSKSLQRLTLFRPNLELLPSEKCSHKPIFLASNANGAEASTARPHILD